MSREDLDETLDFLAGIDTRDLRWQIDQLRKIREWAIAAACDFTEGDKVEMNGTIDLDDLHGWAHYRECMVEGAQATVNRIDFNGHYGYWYADIVFDREWSVNEWAGETHRHWNGPVADTPEGYAAPTEFDQTTYPNGRKHTFAMPVKYLRPASSFVLSPAPEPLNRKEQK